MKSDAVNCWLQHWLKLQQKNKRPLVLKDSSDKPSDTSPTPTIVSKCKGKCSKALYVESDNVDDHDMAEDVDNNDMVGDVDDPHPNADDAATTSNTRPSQTVTNATSLPPSPHSATLTWKSRHTFLASLSGDKTYHRLLLLLYAAKVSNEIPVTTLTDQCLGW
jgi:hypothetical protein